MVGYEEKAAGCGVMDMAGYWSYMWLYGCWAVMEKPGVLAVSPREIYPVCNASRATFIYPVAGHRGNMEKVGAKVVFRLDVGMSIL